jgi:hypothetical protein
MFKKSFIATAVLGALISPLHNAIAAEPMKVEYKQMALSAPTSEAANELTVGPMFLRPGGGNDYGVLVNPFNASVAAPILSPGWIPKGINPNYHAGVLLNYRHLFSNSGNYVNFYWGNLSTSDNASFTANKSAPPAQQMTGPYWNIGPDAGPNSYGKGQFKTNYNQLNAEVGKQLNLDPNLKSRVFFGVSGLWLKEKMSAGFGGTDPILGPYNFSITTQSKFNAAGIRFGMDGEYQSLYNISFVGLFAGGVYVGNQQPSTTMMGQGSILTTAGIPVNHQYISHDNYINVVPGFETKLGVKYSQRYSNQVSFAVEAGYMASVYINAIQNYVPSTYVPGSLGIVSGSVFLQSLIKNTNSFSLDGPYVTFSVKM